MTAKEVMRVAEKLYTKGYISYPRTETNIFPKSLNLNNIISDFTNHPIGEISKASKEVLSFGADPRNGKKTDGAHPPIYPLKIALNLTVIILFFVFNIWIPNINLNSLNTNGTLFYGKGNEKGLYEYVLRHFIACCHKNAVGRNKTVEILIGGEDFHAKGLEVNETNYLDVFVYEKWNSSKIGNYALNDEFIPDDIEQSKGKTCPPNLLTEADLIVLMEKYEIGTDATHAEHIDTIKSRGYAVASSNRQNVSKNIIFFNSNLFF